MDRRGVERSASIFAFQKAGPCTYDAVMSMQKLLERRQLGQLDEQRVQDDGRFAPPYDSRHRTTGPTDGAWIEQFSA